MLSRSDNAANRFVAFLTLCAYRLHHLLQTALLGDRVVEASIKDVALLAGVSATTVSHTLSGNRRVSVELAGRVRAAMETLGYSPSRSARNLALGETRIIGLLVPDIGNAFFAELAKGVERAASGAGYNVVIGNTGFDRERGLMYLEMIRARAVDGVVYAAGSPFTDVEISAAIGTMPLVLLDEEVAGSRAPLVTSQNKDGGRLAAEHLLGLGHRDVLLLSAPRQLVTGADRVQGFLDAWHSGGGGTAKSVDGGFTAQGGQEALRAHMGDITGGSVTAVFAVNDEMAIGALRELRAQNIAVPERVSVVGFDDIRSARDVVPALTTLRQDVSRLGQRAAEILLSVLNGTAQPMSRVAIPVELIVRESTTASGGHRG
jgi:DNA-binding LacI/PurR family transcriptional regulator